MNHFFNTAVLFVAALLFFSSNIAFGDEYPNDNLNIEAQPLASALREFSEQTGLQLGYAAALAEGKRSKGVEGIDDPAIALSALLGSTGLEHRFVNDDTVVIRAAAVAKDEGGSDPGKAQPTPSPALMAQASAAQNQTPQNQTSGQSRDAASTLRGTVRGFITEAYLAGALVTIVETGQSTSTDELGNYRFTSVVPGSYSLRVSFLGLADGVMPIRVSAAEGLRQDFFLTSLVDEIVVYGSRSARALALNKERTSENVSTVISADMLGSFTGTTISDVLRRAPGVSFQRDTATGEGTNIIVRGLSPDFNAVQLNGLNLPVGGGIGRAPDLSNLLVDSVDSITINKTLLPSHDSAGTGGLIQIETKSPLGRAGRTANFTVESGRRSKDFADDFLFSGIVSGVFGESKDFGLSASVQFREATNQTISYSSDSIPGLYLPLDPSGGTALDAANFIDPRLRFPFEGGNGEVYTSRVNSTFAAVDTSTLAVTLSGEWQVAEHTRLQLDVQRTQQERDSSSSSIAAQATAPLPFPGFFGSVGNYQLLPVQALNGEVRQALALNGGLRVTQNYSDSPDTEDITDTISFRGETGVGKWRFDYAAGYVDGSQSSPRITNATLQVRDLIASGLLLPAATDAVEGRVISPFGPRRGSGYPLPLLSEAGWAFANDPANYDLRLANSLRSEGGNERITGKFSTRYDFDNNRLKYLEAGVNFETSEFTNESSSIAYLSNLPFDPFNPFGGLPQPSLTMLGLGFSGMASLSDIGISRGFETVSRSDIRTFLGNIDSFTGSINSPLRRFAFDPHPLEAGTFTRESELAVYFQGRVDIGRLEIIGGVRLSEVEVDANRLVIPRLFDVNGNPDLAFAAEFTQVARDTATVTSLLPRLTLNFRKNDNIVFRGGYFLSVARPQISSLSSTQNVGLSLQPAAGPGFNQPLLTIAEGNPGLKPARTHNLDVSMEIYNNNIGVIKVGGFYKRIDNLIESNFVLAADNLAGVNLPDHPAFQNLPQNILVQRRRPENNDSSAYIWGVEAHVERQFSFLPGFWDGLGVFANYTYSKSSKESRQTWSTSPVLDADGNFTFIPDPFNPFSAGTIRSEQINYVLSSVPFDQQPEHSGTVAITYNKYNIDTALTYSFQSRLQNAIGEFGFSRYNEATETLDFRVEYLLDRLAGTYRIYLEATDLLKGSRDSDLQVSSGGVNGVPKITNDAVYLGGRAIKLGLTASF